MRTELKRARWFASNTLITLLALGIFAAAVTMACGTAEEPTPISTPTPTSAAPGPVATPTPTAAPTATPAPRAKRGGILRSFVVGNGCGGVAVEIETQTCGNSGTQMNAPMYSGLIRYDPVNFTELTPDLATSWKFVAPNKYVFQLRTDAKWTDGTPVTAEDVAHSLNRAVNRKEIRTGRILQPLWGGASVSGPNEVTLVNNPLSALFLPTLATNHMKIYPKHVREAIGDNVLMTANTVVSSGPFKFKEWRHDEYFEVVRHEAYVTSAVKEQNLPYLDGIKTFIIKDTSAQIAAFQAGQVDILPSFPYFTPSQVKTIQDFLGDRVVVKRTPDNTPLWGPQMNSTRPPFNDPRVVKAIWVSIDRPTINNVVEEGFLIPGTLLDPRVFPNAALSLEELASFPGLVKPDYGLAKKLLADAGYPKGLEIPETITRNISEYQDVAQVIIEGFKNAGITVAKHTIADSVSSSARTTAGDFYMQSVVRSGFTVIDPMEPFNATYRVQGEFDFKDPELTALIEKAVATLDAAERNKLTKDIQRKIFTDMTIGRPPVGVGDTLRVQRSYVKDFHRSYTIFEEHRYDVLWLDK